MSLRRDGICAVCDVALSAGTRAEWDSDERVVRCLECVGAAEVAPVVSDDATTSPAPSGTGAEAADVADVVEDVADVAEDVIDLGSIERGTAGASARYEFERRQAKRQAQLEEKYGTGLIGKLAKAFSSDPQTTTAWDKGAVGEIAISAALNKLLGERGIVLDDRKATRGKANFDHLVVGPTGVWIVDTKNYTGKPEVRDVGGWLKTDRRLFVGGRDRSSAVKGMEWQRLAVQRVLDAEGFGDVPLRLALCMYQAEWGLFSKPFIVDDVWVGWAKKLGERILDTTKMADPLDPERLARTAVTLAKAFPPQKIPSQGR